MCSRKFFSLRKWKTITCSLLGIILLLVLNELSKYVARNKVLFRSSLICPAIVGFNKNEIKSLEENYSTLYINCEHLFSNNPDSVKFALNFQQCYYHTLTSKDYISLADDCINFKNSLGYDRYNISEEEESLPIAFSIIFHENIEQAEKLLRAIWRPQNAYCIHLDAKASEDLHEAVTAISRCLPNVFLPDYKIFIRWAEFTVLQAELECIRVLLRSHKQWKYFINLTGREFPIKTNEEIVKILQIYNGSNDIDGTPHKRPIQWTDYSWRNEKWRTNRRKSPPPHNFLLVKGSSHIVANRKFAEYAINDQRANDLLKWMRDIRVPDEHFFQTLNHNPQHDVPGSYKGDPDLKWSYTRLKLWWTKESNCSGQWIRFICNIGAGELSLIRNQPHFFLNKILMEYDPIAFKCLEKWYYWRVMQPFSLNLTFYQQLPFVSNS